MSPTPVLAAPTEEYAVQLDLADLPASQECAVVVQTGVQIGGALYETSARLVVRKTRQQPTATGWLVEATTLDFAQEATNDQEELAGFLADVKSRLLVELDHTGRLQRILNKEELQKKWAALRPALKARYRTSAEVTPTLLDQLGQVLHGDGYLEEVLLRAPEYQLLFPSIFGKMYATANPQSGATTLKRFLGELNLPLLTEARLQAPPAADGACTVQVLGWPAEEGYPAAGIRQAVRTITDRFDVVPTLNLLYSETYALGPIPYQGVTYAASHLHYEVPGVVGREVTALLSTLTA
jgi:hypothetical protein